jgi:(E)-4-hydroxy-3-methylbut-2-enyl-diphosphate synthase
MATTLVICYINDNKAYFVNIGDSRAYLKRGSSIFQVTEDHSYVNTLLKLGVITPDEAKVHERGNVITRAVGAEENVKAVAEACKARHIPIRIGVNAGSLEKRLLEKYGHPCPEAMVESARGHVALLNKYGFDDICLSLKTSSVPLTIQSYRLAAETFDYPLHLGVTETGTEWNGTIQSAVGIGTLLSEGIGDTIRVSLTDEPEREVKVGLEILRALGLRAPGSSVTSCPTCGRTRVDVRRVAEEVEAALERYRREHADAVLPRVAVMGCAVNGPGEAKDADVALCGGDGEFLLYVHGLPMRKVPPSEAVAAVLSAIQH